MTNEKKLELTFCGMLPYGLKAQCIDDELANGRDSMSQYKKGHVFEIYNEDLDSEISKHFKPLLHSLDKLTEPVLDGGLIPIKENEFLKKLTWIKGWENIKSMSDLFVSYSASKSLSEINEIIEELKKLHVNIYDLPSEMFIEKSLTT